MLITCRECDWVKSSKSNSICPRCGYRTPDRARLIGGLIMAGFFALLVFSLVC